MGPKKSSRKKAVSPSKDAFIATNEDELRKRVEEAEAQLREEAKIIERMTRDNKAKQEQLNAMDALLQREAERHVEALRLADDEHQSLRLQAEHDVEVLRARSKELELHVEAYDVLETANAALRDRVERLVDELEVERRAHAEEIHKVRLDMFNHKMALEKTFRKALQELDADYLKKAFNAMSEESKNALIANAKLKDELQLQSIGVDNLMQRFTQQAKHFQDMKVANEILEQESQLRLQEVATMKKQQLSASREMQKLKEHAGKEEQEWKEQASHTIDELRRENQHLTKLHDLAQKRCSKWKSRCQELTEREATRQSEAQRVQTAPLNRVLSQPALLGQPPTSVSLVNFDEMWSASLAAGRRGNQQLETPTTVLGQADSRVETLTDLSGIRSLRSSNGDTARRKPHRVSASILPRRGQTDFNFAT